MMLKSMLAYGGIALIAVVAAMAPKGESFASVLAAPLQQTVVSSCFCRSAVPQLM